MGATTTISVFHHDRYRSCVVPAVRRLLRSGEIGPWLQAVWDHRNSRYPATVGRPFLFEPNGHAEVQLDDDLLPTPVPGEEWFYLPDKQTMERANLIDLFQHAVEQCCLGDSAVCRNNPVTDLTDDEDGFIGTAELHGMLWRLTNGAEIWNHGNRAAQEGIRGWLNLAETAALARELHRMNLAERPPELSLFGVNHSAYFQQRAEASLFQIREIADRAWALGQGVLCGNDLEPSSGTGLGHFFTPHPAYSTETVQLLARAIRDRREFDVLPVLADALQEAGCENEVVLTHCRDANEHTDACWVADLILSHAP